MKITVRSSFNLNEADIEIQSTTLGALLDELQNYNQLEVPAVFNSRYGEVYPFGDVLINGQSFRVLADGLDTKLRDSDKVELRLNMFLLMGG